MSATGSERTLLLIKKIVRSLPGAMFCIKENYYYVRNRQRAHYLLYQQEFVVVPFLVTTQVFRPHPLELLRPHCS